jgi:hypothetical protein
MSEPEKFLERWSRRKRGAAETGTAETLAEPPHNDRVKKEQTATPMPKGEGTGPDEGGFDPANLPALDSIGADTDIRDFLRPDVPSDLTREALRRAWSSDPLIRDYIGPVENGWDFNDPNAMLGFGAIKAEEIPHLLAQVFGAPTGDEREPSAPENPVAQQDLPSPQTPSPAVATTEVAGPDVRADAESSQRDANVAQARRTGPQD